MGFKLEWQSFFSSSVTEGAAGGRLEVVLGEAR